MDSKGLGVVHVLTGPDHMTAVATLSANVPTRQAFWLGVRWGVGHSIGLLLVGIILIAITAPAKYHEEDGGEEVVVPHTVETVFESLVGVFMLLLGAYGIHRAVSRRRTRRADAEKEELRQQQQQQEEEENDDAREQSSDLEEGGADGAPPAGEGPPVDGSVSPATAHVLLRGISVGQDKEAEFQPAADVRAPRVLLDGEGSALLVAGAADASPRANEGATSATSGAGAFQAEDGAAPTVASIAGGEDGGGDPAPVDDDVPADPSAPAPRCCRCATRISDRVSTGLAALIMGTVHGLAGPGGILGVIPAVQLRDWKLAILYLGTFCVVSTLTMGTFATVFGTLSSKLVDRSAARLQFCMEFFPSCLSIVVGIVWLVLSPMGKLEEIFG
jgi:hypothetical protein